MCEKYDSNINGYINRWKWLEGVLDLNEDGINGISALNLSAASACRHTKVKICIMLCSLILSVSYTHLGLN